MTIVSQRASFLCVKASPTAPCQAGGPENTLSPAPTGPYPPASTPFGESSIRFYENDIFSNCKTLRLISLASGLHSCKSASNNRADRCLRQRSFRLRADPDAGAPKPGRPLRRREDGPDTRFGLGSSSSTTPRA